MLETIRNWRAPLIIALVGWVAVVCTRRHPGITSDEPFNVVYGIDFVTRLYDRGWDFFTPESINETFANRSEHPPLGRWFIGTVHRLWDRSPVERNEYDIEDIRNARVAPATAFALLLALVTRVVTARSGMVAGIAAGVSLLLMPPVFAHAHFAALDTIVACAYFLGIMSAAWMMERRWSWIAAPVAGLFLGMALLTKIHGLFLLPVVGLWALGAYHFRSLAALMLWFFTGVMVFFCGWPWLWQDLHSFWSKFQDGAFAQSGWISLVPHIFSRTSAFLGTMLDRAPIFVSYLGRHYRDSELPWHYSWVIFATAVPVGIQLLALCGLGQHCWRQRSDRRGWLYLMAVMVPLVAFSVPRVPVYDGSRLFLMVFPFWAIWAGQGAGAVVQWLQTRWSTRWAAVAISFFLACQGFGLVYYHPFQLSYYNLLTGGLRGAERLGLEVTYWGDSITTDFLDRWSSLAPHGACAELVPTLYEGHAELYQSTGMLKKSQRLLGTAPRSCSHVVVYNRRAYLESVQSLIDDPNERPLVENKVDGVWVARVYRRPEFRPAEPPAPKIIEVDSP